METKKKEYKVKKKKGIGEYARKLYTKLWLPSSSSAKTAVKNNFSEEYL